MSGTCGNGVSARLWCGCLHQPSLPSTFTLVHSSEAQAPAPATGRIPTARGRLPARCPGWGAGPRPGEIGGGSATPRGYWGKGGPDPSAGRPVPSRRRRLPQEKGPCRERLAPFHPRVEGLAGAPRRRVGGAHLQSLPSVLLSSALCRCGYWSASFLRAACAHTMKAFMGRLTCGLLLLAPLTRTGMGTRVQS